MNAKQIWQTTIERLQTKVSSIVFTTWFQGTSGHSFQDGVFTVHVPTPFVKVQLEGRFLDLIRPILSEITGTPTDVQFVVAKDLSEQPPEEETSQRPAKRSYRLGKGRLSTALRGKRSSENAATTMNSIAPTTTSANAYHSSEPEPPQHSFSNRAVPTTPDFQDPHANYQYSSLPSDAKKWPEPNVTMTGGPAVEGLLNTRYTFSTFIVGKSNQLAHAASFAAAENPGRIYNPLFLYGGVGLGKTHLMHAIGHAGEKAGLNVLYVTSEKFTNEIINAIRFQKTEEFRSKYRQIDILLVDDIQFIAGKESTEEEFFHTFNTLHNANKQIVVTSDRPPKAINSLQDRLRSRFEWGLLADVQAPEYEHRLAILRSKSESLRFTVPAGVIEYIARPQCSSVRELEGALNRVIAYATLHDAPLTTSLATQALAHLYETRLPASAASLSIPEVLEGVCRYYNVTDQAIQGRQRDRDIAWPRQVAMYLMREETKASLLQIGSALGGRDHTTIMHGWEKVRTEISNNDNVRQEIAAILETLHRPVFD